MFRPVPTQPQIRTGVGVSPLQAPALQRRAWRPRRSRRRLKARARVKLLLRRAAVVRVVRVVARASVLTRFLYCLSLCAVCWRLQYDNGLVWRATSNAPYTLRSNHRPRHMWKSSINLILEVLLAELYIVSYIPAYIAPHLFVIAEQDIVHPHQGAKKSRTPVNAPKAPC